MQIGEDVTIRVIRHIAGPYQVGDVVTVVRTDMVEAWLRAGLFEIVEPE